MVLKNRKSPRKVDTITPCLVHMAPVSIHIGITVCTKDRQWFFGRVEDGAMVLNDIGKQCYDEIARIPTARKNVHIGEYVVMPNHIHAIIIIGCVDGNDREGYWTGRDTFVTDPVSISDTGGSTKSSLPDGKPTDDDQILVNRDEYTGPTLGSIVGTVKSNVTKYANQNDIAFGRQRSYHDVIIRNQGSYDRITRYIQNNPKKRSEDKFYT